MELFYLFLYFYLYVKLNFNVKNSCVKKCNLVIVDNITQLLNSTSIIPYFLTQKYHLYIDS